MVLFHAIDRDNSDSEKSLKICCTKEGQRLKLKLRTLHHLRSRLLPFQDRISFIYDENINELSFTHPDMFHIGIAVVSVHIHSAISMQRHVFPFVNIGSKVTAISFRFGVDLCVTYFFIDKIAMQ